jgi:hypothetical protein
MKVKELISLLEKYPPDNVVIVRFDTGLEDGFLDISSVTRINVSKDYYRPDDKSSYSWQRGDTYSEPQTVVLLKTS